MYQIVLIKLDDLLLDEIFDIFHFWLTHLVCANTNIVAEILLLLRVKHPELDLCEQV